MATNDPRRLRDWITGEFSSLDAVVLDIDGVLIRARRALPGATDFFETLRALGLPFRLLTNDASSSAREKVGYLCAAGVDVREEDLFSSGHALADFVEERGLRGECFYLMGRLGDPCYARAAGLETTRNLQAMERTRGIVVGEKEFDWEPNINAAVNFLIRDPAALFVCPNPDTYFPARDGRIHLSSGAVTRFLSDMVEGFGRPCRPVYLGKPHAPIFAANHAFMEKQLGLPTGGLSRQRVLMIGDSLTGDIAGARTFGYRTALVLTGLTDADLLAGSSIQPELVFESL